MEIRDLDSIQTLQPKLLRSIKSALGLVDYFSTFKDIDQDKMSAIGISFGGFRTLYLMGLDMRIKGATIVVAGSSFARALAYSTLPFIRKIRELQMAYTGITSIEDYIAELEKSLTIKPTDLLCRRSKDDFFLYMAYKDSVVPYSLQEDLWHRLDTPFVKRVKFGHYGGALYFGMSNLKETMEFMKYSWYK
jgi:cephalosporin-C deacetylase-like acetyl esterase